MPRDLNRFLGDGGMPLLRDLGVSFTAYEPLRAEASWRPTAACCNPQGVVQAGVHAVVLDAAMNFAMLAALEPGERGATLDLGIATMRPARESDDLCLVGFVPRLARRVAWCEAEVRDGSDRLVSKATATFIVNRREE